MLSTVSWINPNGGDWDTPSNWSTGALPGPSDDVVVNQSGIAVTHSTSAVDTVDGLTISSSRTSLDISGGTLALSTNSSIAGSVSIEGATLSTAGYLAVAGPFTNDGSVIVQAGALDLGFGAPSRPTDASGPGTVTGTFYGAAGTTMALGYQDMAAAGGISGDDVSVSGNIRCPIDVTGTASIGEVSFTNPDTALANISMVESGNSDFRTGGTITTGQTIFVLDPSAGGALSLSGSAGINIAGGVYVDPSSSSALSASGAPSIKASVIDVHGGVQKSGSPSFSPSPTAGAAVAADPLGSLPEPSTSGLTNHGTENLSGASSATIQPGVYSAINVSGSASLTLASGTYIIEGGGFSVSGAGSVTGSGVLIVNAGSKYPTTGGTYGSITLSGSGSYKLTPPTTGTYAGIVIFQARDNTKAMTVSGAASGMTGTIYAPAASLTISGSGQLNAALVVDTLTLSGAAVANAMTLSAPSGTVAYTPAQIRAAYGISSLSLVGTGQTIAIVDAYDDPSLLQALDAFDGQFGLTANGPTLADQYGPASSFLTVLNQDGQATSLPSTDPSGPGGANWELEEALDVEWTHAIAPGARIILVEADSQSLLDLMASVATAAAQPGVSVVSMSWGFPEGQSVFATDEASDDPVFDVPGVTFLASTGDYGAADPEYPAFSPDVVAVGGTSLTLNTDSSYSSETGWGYDSATAGTLIGSGGGISLYEPEPTYQQGVQSTGYRTTPDVSMVADPATG